jgi:predicted nucleic acid-binding protein
MSKRIDYRTYIDTNVLVDYYTGQDDAVACLKYLFSTNRKENLFTSSLALVQTVSQLQKKNVQRNRKAVPKDKVIEYLKFLSTKFTIADLTERDVVDSFPLENNDIEDNVHYIISKKLKCKRIITRNTKDYSKFTELESLSPNNITLIKKKII